MTPSQLAQWPMRISTETNRRDAHWGKRNKRRGSHRSTAALQMRAAIRTRPKLPVVIVLVRVAPRRLDDGNLASAFKGIQDGIADWLGVDDGDSQRVAWLYDQRQGRPKQHLVCVELYEGAAVVDVRKRIVEVA